MIHPVYSPPACPINLANELVLDIPMAGTLGMVRTTRRRRVKIVVAVCFGGIPLDMPVARWSPDAGRFVIAKAGSHHDYSSDVHTT